MGARDVLASLALVDHHCHGLVRGDLDRAGFEALLSEGGAPAAGTTHFDTPLGLAIRRHCAPLLDLAPHADPDGYLARRAALGAAEVARRLLSAAGTGTFCVDTGYRAGALGGPAEVAAAAGGGAVGREVVRLETVAEVLAAGGVEPAEFGAAFGRALATAVSAARAVAVKSVAAYRCGLELAAAPPAPAALATAAGHWLDRGPGPAGYRVTDPVLVSALVWTAVELGLPIQFHAGFGDRDVTLHRANPALLTGFLRAAPARVPVVLLHCFPYHREASYLAAVYDQVHLDVGLALNHVGPVRAAAVLAEALDLAPFGKMLYSSDAFGLPELYALGALGFRRGLGALLDDRVAAGEWAAADAARLARAIGRDNAERVYRLAAAAPAGREEP